MEGEGRAVCPRYNVLSLLPRPGCGQMLQRSPGGAEPSTWPCTGEEGTGNAGHSGLAAVGESRKDAAASSGSRDVRCGRKTSLSPCHRQELFVYSQIEPSGAAYPPPLPTPPAKGCCPEVHCSSKTANCELIRYS